MGKAAVTKAFEEINAALAVLNAEAAGSGSEPFSDADPLAGLADGCLEILIGAAGVQAMVSGLVANAAGTYADTARAAAPPDAPVQAQEMAIAAEIGSLLALSDRAAGALLAQSHALTTSLPRTLAALHNGTISWQHAKVMVDETATLDPAGAAALEAHFLDPDMPRPAAAAAIGEMPAYRFRHKARTWRERHHTESIEKRHAKGVAERRVEYRPDQDGMAWFSVYLPGDQALGGWNRLTELSRAMQGPDEERTLTQLRADNFAEALLGSRAGVLAGTAAAGPSSSIRAQVLVTVPVFSLLGLTDELAMLDGHGPIPASMARKLVADGADSFYRVLVDPKDGLRWRSDVPVTGSPKLSGGGCACGTESARSRVAATTRWTTKQTTCWPGIKAELPGSATWASPARSTTGSSTPARGHPPRRPRTNRQAGSRHRADDIRASTRTGNHHTGPST